MIWLLSTSKPHFTTLQTLLQTLRLPCCSHSPSTWHFMSFILSSLPMEHIFFLPIFSISTQIWSSWRESSSLIIGLILQAFLLVYLPTLLFLSSKTIVFIFLKICLLVYCLDSSLLGSQCLEKYLTHNICSINTCRLN